MNNELHLDDFINVDTSSMDMNELIPSDQVAAFVVTLVIVLAVIIIAVWIVYKWVMPVALGVACGTIALIGLFLWAFLILFVCLMWNFSIKHGHHHHHPS